MKVIVAGISKTGTKSMTSALKELGYNVYDYLEHYLYNGNDWINICKNGGTIEDFRRMHEGVDAVVDMPSWHFWEELHEAFPDAKIILTMRDSEDAWVQSQISQYKTVQNPFMVLMKFLSPTFWMFNNYGAVLGLTCYGISNQSWFRMPDLNELVLRMTYRRHNTYVLETAPKDKLLVYNVKEGWEPLCNFLGVDVPSTPFPHKNVRGGITKELMMTNPFFIRMQREMICSSLGLALLVSYGCYRFFKSPPKSTITQWLSYGTDTIGAIGNRAMFWK